MVILLPPPPNKLHRFSPTSRSGMHVGRGGCGPLPWRPRLTRRTLLKADSDRSVLMILPQTLTYFPRESGAALSADLGETGQNFSHGEISAMVSSSWKSQLTLAAPTTVSCFHYSVSKDELHSNICIQTSCQQNISQHHHNCGGFAEIIWKYIQKNEQTPTSAVF